MTLQGGDPAYPDADEITVVNAEGSTVEAGQLVTIVGHNGDHPTVELADANDSNYYDGVMADDVADGEAQTVRLRGAYVARVESGATAGQALTTPDSSGTGTAGVGVGAAPSGEYEDRLHDDAVEMPSGSGNYYAPVQLD